MLDDTEAKIYFRFKLNGKRCATRLRAEYDNSGVSWWQLEPWSGSGKKGQYEWFREDGKVITNKTASFNPSDIELISIAAVGISSVNKLLQEKKNK